MKWIFFSYSLPAEPSKARVHVWRRLKKLGAVNYQNVWLVPHSNERVSDLKKLTEDIKSYNGGSLLISGRVLDEDQEKEVHKVFTESRNEEYEEVIEKCEDFFKEIDFEIERKNFIFAEVEENEEELEKLKYWLKKIEKRDIIRPPLHKEAVKKIRLCEKRFEEFAQRVYEYNNANLSKNQDNIFKDTKKAEDS